MKIYKRIVLDKDDNVIEAELYDYEGPVAEAKGGSFNPFKAVTNIFKKAFQLIGKVIKGIVSAVTSPFGMNISTPDYDIGQNQAEQIQGVLVNKDSAISDIPVVYGTRKVGGTRVFVSTSGASNKYLYVAFVLSEGPINAFSKLFIDDNEVSLDAYGHGVLANATLAKYSGRLQVQFFDGRDDQVASSLLSEAPGWTSAHTLNGLAYLALRFEWIEPAADATINNNPYGGGVPQLQAVIQGRKIFDATTLGSTHTTAYAAESVVFTNNPVSILLDYLRNTRYGKGLGNDVFEWQSFGVAADLCEQTVTYNNSATSKAFTCDIVVDTAVNMLTNAKIIITGFRGIMPYQQGLYYLKVEHGGDDTNIAATPATPATVFTVTNDHVIGGMQLEGETKENKCNRCVVTYVDPEADFQPNDVVFPADGSAEDLAFLASDGGRLEKKITLPACTDRKIAEQYGRVFVRRSRNQKLISFATNLATSNVSVGDLIQVVNPFLGLDGIFRIMDMRIKESGDVEINATEHQSSSYAIDGSGTDYVRPTINLPDPSTILPPTALTATFPDVLALSEVDVLGPSTQYNPSCVLNWTASQSPFTKRYEVSFRPSEKNDFTAAGITADTRFNIFNLQPGMSYDFRVAAISGDFVRSSYATVSGLTKELSISLQEQAVLSGITIDSSGFITFPIRGKIGFNRQI